MVVTSTEAVATAIGTTSNAEVVVMTNTCLVVQILPIGIVAVALVQRVLVQTGILTELSYPLTVLF